MQTELETHRIMQGTCYTDEHLAYWDLADKGVSHSSVRHAIKEWARDDDGDGIREVHTNTMEGFWTELRNFLRPFRGISKWHLHHYAAMYEWIHNHKSVDSEFAQALTFTQSPT